jgi:hypothetical protein
MKQISVLQTRNPIRTKWLFFPSYLLHLTILMVIEAALLPQTEAT